MRGSKTQLNVIRENKVTRKLLLKSMILCNILAVIIYIANSETDVFKYALRSIVEVVVCGYLYRISTPVITSDGKIDVLVDPGTPLSGRGSVGVAFDILFISMIVKLLLLYSRKALFLYLFVPISCGYEFICKPFSILRKKNK